jgi:saccharopine dehydrogenase-like NADP-dependent oxidoreductase
MTNQTIHWLGAGLSSGPGIIRLAESGRNLVLWNRTVQRAEDVFAGSPKPATTTVRPWLAADFQAAVNPGDIVVSMLPATMHGEIAAICLENNAHLVTTSYVSEAMQQLDAQAAAAGLCFVNECGLDPGIDHVFAHLLVKAWKESPAFDPSAELDFKSYCGGVPKQPNEFKYKFSWSPAGVLRALTNRARFIENGHEAFCERAWEAVKNLVIRGEEFEVYPNRDSVPYVAEYGFEKSWNVRNFVRGTIRLGGWKQAWSGIFAQIPTASNEKIDALGAELWSQHAYAQGEEDRVVLYVNLTARQDGETIFDQCYFIDDSGSGRDTSMARLVSWPATFAVEAVAEGRVKPGVTAAPHEPAEMNAWLENLKSSGVIIHR